MTDFFEYAGHRYNKRYVWRGASLIFILVTIFCWLLLCAVGFAMLANSLRLKWQDRKLLASKIDASSKLDLRLLASADCRAEIVSISAVIIAELELDNIEQHVFLADRVEGADNAALDNGPESLRWFA